MRPKISVIMPSYNVVNYIETAVDSVRNQTMRDIEIICIDAGSNDGTLEKLEKIKNEDERIILIDHFEKSYGKQVNRGMAISRGDYLAIVETDDYINSDMLEILLKYGEMNNCDFVKGDYKAFWTQNNGEAVFLDRKTVTNEKLYNKCICPLDDYSLATSDWYLWTGLYRRDFIIENKIYFSETPGAAFQDIGFLHKTYVKAKRAYYVDEPFYNYCIDRVDSSSNIGKGIDFSYYEYQRLFEEKWSYNEEKAIYCRMACFFSGCINGITVDDLQNELVLEKFNWFLAKLLYAIQTGIINDKCIYKSIWETIYPLPKDMKNAYERNINKNDSLMDAIGKSRDINVFIFGCGTFGYYAYKWLIYHKYRISGYFDNNEDLWGKRINDIPVLPIEKIKSLGENDRVVIANEKYGDDIYKQLISAGVHTSNISRFK